MNLKMGQWDDLDSKRFYEDGDFPGGHEEGPPSWTELRKEREGLKCIGPTEVRGPRGGAGEWNLTQGQWVTDICLACSGVWRGTPSSRWALGKGNKRERTGVSMCVVHGERKLQNLSFLCLD